MNREPFDDRLSFELRSLVEEGVITAPPEVEFAVFTYPVHDPIGRLLPPLVRLVGSVNEYVTGVLA